MPRTSATAVDGGAVSNGRAAAVLAWAVLGGPIVLALLELPHAAWTAMLGYHAGCLVAVRLAGGAGPHERFGPAALLGLGTASAAVVFASGAAFRAMDLVPRGAVAAWSAWGLVPPHDLVWLAYYVLVNPWVEERYWRGALLRDPVRARIGRSAGLALAVLGFGIHHAVVLGPSLGWVRGLLLVLPIMAAGAVWTALRARGGGLALPIASHRGADLGLAVLYLWTWRG